MAEACGSRTQTFNSQLTANDDVAASAKFQLESIGVSPAKLRLFPSRIASLLTFVHCFPDYGIFVVCPRFAAHVSHKIREGATAEVRFDNEGGMALATK
jgi:hypothetical protein